MLKSMRTRHTVGGAAYVFPDRRCGGREVRSTAPSHLAGDVIILNRSTPPTIDRASAALHERSATLARLSSRPDVPRVMRCLRILSVVHGGGYVSGHDREPSGDDHGWAVEPCFRIDDEPDRGGSAGSHSRMGDCHVDLRKARTARTAGVCDRRTPQDSDVRLRFLVR